MRTIEAAVQFIKDNGIHYADGECERIVNNAGGFTHSYGLARLSMEASPVPLNPDYSAAPDGMLHYWTGAWGTWGRYGYTDAGHVMFGYRGLLWGDSGVITGHYNNARFAGSVSKGDLEAARRNLHYKGWTPYHGPETLAGISTAAVKSDPLINHIIQGDDMYSIRNWQTQELSLLIGTQRLVLPGTLDVAGIAAVATEISGQPADATSTAPGPWVNLSSAQIALLDSALALYPKPASTAPIDVNALAKAVAAQIAVPAVDDTRVLEAIAAIKIPTGITSTFTE
jgi:hypothetical protein